MQKIRWKWRQKCYCNLHVCVYVSEGWEWGFHPPPPNTWSLLFVTSLTMSTICYSSVFKHKYYCECRNHVEKNMENPKTHLQWKKTLNRNPPNSNRKGTRNLLLVVVLSRQKANMRLVLVFGFWGCLANRPTHQPNTKVVDI
jgi:hypothetical protein